MKKLLVLMGLTAAVMSMALAQTPGPGGQPGQGGKAGKGQARPGQMRKMQEEIFAKLGLSADQKSKIEALNKKMAADFQAMMKAGNREENRTKMRDMMKKHRDSVMAVLNTQQKAKYQQLLKEMAAKRGQPGGKGGKPGKGGGAAGGATGGGGGA